MYGREIVVNVPELFLSQACLAQSLEFQLLLLRFNIHKHSVYFIPNIKFVLLSILSHKA